MEVHVAKLTPNEIYQGDCIQRLEQLDAGSVHLAFADPPFNIGYEYDVYHDKQSYDEYLAWSRRWMSGVVRALRPDGTFWLAIGDEYAAELKMIAQRELGLACRSWVIWYYTFGVNCKRKFSRSHAHLFHFVRDEEQFTFNLDDSEVRIPSARQLVYGDRRANPRGRLPDDTWILRPQDLPGGFQPQDDVWYFPRVAGTFKERAGFHGCQMPEQLLGRIVRLCSNAGDLVLDPFAGSGTTLSVAKKLDRHWIGFELSKDYVTQVRSRLKAVEVGQPLNGPADPLASAPSTTKGRRLADKGAPASRPGTKDAEKPDSRAASESRPAAGTKTRGESSNGKHANGSPEAEPRNDARSSAVTKRGTSPDANRRARRRTLPKPVRDEARGVIQAFLAASQGFSTDRVLADPKLNAAFLSVCRRSSMQGKPIEWNRQLLRLRKAGMLPAGLSSQRTSFSAAHMDQYRFASEIAMQMLTEGDERSLDDILCDPKSIKQFDKTAAEFAPGFKPLNYRWAALRIRKHASEARHGQGELPGEITRKRLSRACPLDQIDFDAHRESAGVYLIESLDEGPLYAGHCRDLGAQLHQLAAHWEQSAWSEWKATVRWKPLDAGFCGQMQSKLIGQYQPRLNFRALAPEA
jgi:site-specific DNA-methyltransferase (adenine-specific)